MRHPRDAMSEKCLLQAVRDLVALLGLRAYHTHDARRSEPGFPDLVIVGARGIVWRELKTAAGRVSASQAAWIADLLAAGADVAIWRPSDLHNGLIATQLANLKGPK